MALPLVASAHAGLLAAEPAPGASLSAPPGQVLLRFSEPVTAAGAGLRVIGPDGRRADRGPIAAEGATLAVAVDAGEPGTYRVRWEVIAQDTHPGRGTYSFNVGLAAPGSPAGDLEGDLAGVSPGGLVLEVIARWSHLLGMALSFGVIAASLLVPVPEPRLRRLVAAGIMLLIAAEPLALAGQAAGLGVPASDVAASSWGRVSALRLGGALLLWAGIGATRAAGGRGRPALLGLGLAVALADAASAHRLAGLPGAAAVGLAGVHEAAMALWGGAVATSLAHREGRRRLGRLALAVLTLLGVTGLALAAAHLRGPGDLGSGPYGVTLGLKVVVIAGATVLGLLGDRRREALALGGAIALAALLVSLPPPR